MHFLLVLCATSVFLRGISALTLRRLPRSQPGHEFQENAETVGGPLGLLRLHGLHARARAHALAARARLRHPLLLQATPKEFVDDPEVMLGSIDSANVTKSDVANMKTINGEKASLRTASSYYGPETEGTAPVSYNNEGNLEEEAPPSFSIIPIHWKPPPGSNLYVHEISYPQYSSGSAFSLNVLPGEWRTTTKYGGDDGQDYQITPVSYNLAGYGGYGRSSESEEPPGPFLGVKEQLKSWEDNPKVWRADSSEKQRTADPDPHFHKHHSHTLIHQHFSQHLPQHGGGFQDFHQNSIKPHGHQITINKQTVIVPHEISPPTNFQLAQVAGHHNSVSQSQTSSGQWKNQNFQSGQVFGNQNALSQSQASHEAPFLSVNTAPFVGEPYLIRAPHWRTHSEKFQRSFRKRSVDDNLMENCRTTHHRELYRRKRSIPLLRLVADPNAKMDVEKTIENLGTVVRNSFENKREPMYHIKNVLGSAKDVFLSSLRIPSQNLLVPSRYSIVDSERRDENLQSTDGNMLQEPSDFSNTYNRIGSMFRESVQSGKDALSHVGEMYHSARKAVASARHVAPRVLLSSLRIPAVQRPNRLHPPKKEDKLLLITPKILQLKQEGVGIPHYADNSDDFVGLPRITDSLGLTNPQAEDVGFRRVVFHPRTPPVLQSPSNFAAAEVEEELKNKPRPKPKSKIRKNERKSLGEKYKKYYVLADTFQKQASEDLHETLDALNNAKEAVGASNLQDFVLKMKNDLSHLFRDKLEEAKHKFNVHLVSPVVNLDFRKQNFDVNTKTSPPLQNGGWNPNINTAAPNKPFTPEEEAKVSAFLTDLFVPQQQNSEKTQPEPQEFQFAPQTPPTPKNKNEGVVGAGLPLAAQLLKPFMGQPSQSQRRTFFEEYGDVEEIQGEEEQQKKDEPIEDLTTAINPEMFEKVTKQSLEGQTPLNESQTVDLPKGFKTLHDLKKDLKLSGILGAEAEDLNGSVSVTKNKNCSVHHHNSTFFSNASSLDTLNETQNITASSNEEFEPKIAEGLQENNQTDSLGTILKLGKKLLTPFMGKIKDKDVEVYFESYEDEDSDEDSYLGSSKKKNSPLKTEPTETSTQTFTTENSDAILGQSLQDNAELDENNEV